MKNLICLVCVLVVLGSIYGQEFTSARATAIGAYTAVSNDVYGVDWNLAATTLSNNNLEIAFSNNNYIRGFDDFRLIMRLWKRHVIAFRTTPSFFVIHPIWKRLHGVPSGTAMDFLEEVRYVEDRAVGYAFRFSSQAAVGLDIRRHIYSNIFSSGFWSLNLSFYFRINPKVSFGIISRNLYNYHYRKPYNQIRFYKGNTLHLVDVDFESFQSLYSSPARRLDLGVAISPWSRLLLSVDMFSDGGYGAGFEWEAIKHIFLRMGVNHKSDRLFKPEKVFGLSWGLGVAYGPARFDLGYYFPYGSRGEGYESTSFGDIYIQPIQRDVLILSAQFSIGK